MSKQKGIRIPYARPEALDIGSVAPILGYSCVRGDHIGDGVHVCQVYGNSAPGGCEATGNSAGTKCNVGNSRY